MCQSVSHLYVKHTVPIWQYACNHHRLCIIVNCFREQVSMQLAGFLIITEINNYDKPSTVYRDIFVLF